MVNVTATKIRDNTRRARRACMGRPYSGYLISFPTVGRGMVIFRDPAAHRMVTTPVAGYLASSSCCISSRRKLGLSPRFRSPPAVEEAARAAVKSG